MLLTKVCILVESAKKYNGNVSLDRFPFVCPILMK